MVTSWGFTREDLLDGWNRKGLISETGDKKMAFYIMQKYYRDKEITWDK